MGLKWQVVFFALALPLALTPAATIRLSGTIIDENNRGVEGALVTLYSTTGLQVITDGSGAFELIGEIAGSSVRAPSVDRGGFRAANHQAGEIRTRLYDFKGRKLKEWAGGEPAINWGFLHAAGLPAGLYLISIDCGGRESGLRRIVSGKGTGGGFVPSVQKQTGNFRQEIIAAEATGFSDILVVSAEKKQTVRRAVTEPVESDITVKMMPIGVGYITPGIPVFSERGGVGDVTTYGSVHDSEFSQGGACNYGSTRIRYYAAINVNQIPGDGRGQWQGGRCCGRCARVRIRAANGEERTTVVRIVDRCADANCGIDLGGAPASALMKDQPGRYAGEWEWVNCDEFDGVSDGPPSVYVKEGSNEWWSLIQIRNGPGAVSRVRFRGPDDEAWRELEPATEAENFFRVPPEILRDSATWEVKVEWETGASGSLHQAGTAFERENASYQLQR